MATSTAGRRPAIPLLVLAGLAASLVALALAPQLMPASYSAIANTTSESGAQGVPGAWLGRLGLLLFGLSVVALAFAARPRWGPLAAALHYAFGVLLTATATFSTRPWTDAPFDPTEDALHSVAATAMGFAFIAGVVSAAVYRVHLVRQRRTSEPSATASAKPSLSVWLIDAVALAAALAIPPAMMAFPAADGLLQRILFVAAYLWYGSAAAGLRLFRPALG